MGATTTLLQEEGYKMMEAAFEVYNEHGYGLAEEIYQESLEIELGLREIPRARPSRNQYDPTTDKHGWTRIRETPSPSVSIRG
jgi:hypothetical protein